MIDSAHERGNYSYGKAIERRMLPFKKESSRCWFNWLRPFRLHRAGKLHHSKKRKTLSTFAKRMFPMQSEVTQYWSTGKCKHQHSDVLPVRKANGKDKNSQELPKMSSGAQALWGSNECSNRGNGIRFLKHLREPWSLEHQHFKNRSALPLNRYDPPRNRSRLALVF